MSLYKGAKTRVRVYSKLSMDFEAKLGMHHESVLSHFCFAVTELVRKCVLSELMHADDLLLMSETIDVTGNNFRKWTEGFESKGLKVNFGKTKLMVSSGITKESCLKVKLTHVELAAFE